MPAPEPRGPRLRELGLRIGRFQAGPTNAITDVTGVAVGHVTIWRDEAEPPEGRGIARTGVTAVVPAPPDTLFDAPVPAGVAVLNGAGELTGSLAVAEWGLLETPVYLTSTHAVGRVYDGAVAAAVAADPRVGVEDVAIPVVGECDDSWLSEARVVQVEAEDAARAVASAAGGAVMEGAVGAGTGMLTKGYKAGIGTSSRVVPAFGGAAGVLVLANFSAPPGLVVAGVPIGELLGEPRGVAAGGGELHRRRRGRRRLVVETARASRASRRPGAGADRLGGASRKRRDLPRVRASGSPTERRASGSECSRSRPQRRLRGRRRMRPRRRC